MKFEHAFAGKILQFAEELLKLKSLLKERRRHLHLGSGGDFEIAYYQV